MKKFVLIVLPIIVLALNTQCSRKNNAEDKNPLKPNIVLIMADDLGWGDVGFNGNTVIKTPNLDKMAAEGIIFNRFYSASPICSPTRGSILSGRNPYRYGIYKANEGSLPKEEITLSEVLKENGYATGHFGKWHLGTLSDSLPDGRRGGPDTEFYSPPWEHGFDVCFSTEQAVATWDPMKDQFTEYPTRYWTGYRKFETDNLEGSTPRVIIDRVIPFIENAKNNNQPFFALVWFHTPHMPVIAGPEYRRMYENFDENKQHYYGCITAMDEQIGRLYKELAKSGCDKNTFISFISDNGPAGEGLYTSKKGDIPGGRKQGDTGGFRHRKISLYEGGVRVPGFFIWPDKIPKGLRTDFMAVTSDYFPTIMNILGIEMPERPYDGIDIFPALEGKITERQKNIGFQTPYQVSWVSDQYKLITPEREKNYYELYDLVNDKFEKTNIVNQQPEVVSKMKNELNEWIESCKKSEEGMDY